MKKSTKRIVALGIFATYALSLCSGLQYIGNRSVLADEIKNDPTIATTNFYDNLTLEGKDGEKEEYTLAKKFYNALSDIYANGDFKDGRVEYLIPESVATTAQIKGYVDGTDLSVPKAFSAARDAFLTDHPELFYIDFYKLTISVGRSNGVYKAYIDSGREANLYRDNSFTMSRRSVRRSMISTPRSTKSRRMRLKPRAKTSIIPTAILRKRNT